MDEKSIILIIWGIVMVLVAIIISTYVIIKRKESNQEEKKSNDDGNINESNNINSNELFAYILSHGKLTHKRKIRVNFMEKYFSIYCMRTAIFDSVADTVFEIPYNQIAEIIQVKSGGFIGAKIFIKNPEKVNFPITDQVVSMGVLGGIINAIKSKNVDLFKIYFDSEESFNYFYNKVFEK